MRKMSREEDVARLAAKLIGDPLRRIVWLKMTRGRELRERVARAPKAFSGLLRPEFPAVPDYRWLDPLRRTIGREFIDRGAPVRG